MKTIGIIGAGAWGTALAAVLASSGDRVVLAAREKSVAEAVREKRENTPFLPDVPLPEDLEVTLEAGDALESDIVLLVTPSQFLRATLSPLAEAWRNGVPAVLCCKGIEQGTGALMSDVAADVLGPDVPLAVLSGPTFAGEVARGLPTAVTLAMDELGEATRLAEALARPTFRVYAADDVIGSEVGGALKNVLAIACGIVEGRGLGDNARAALITRGLAEISRLSLKLGGRPETLMGLSGLGDITLTCNAMQSRNFSLGAALGKGETLGDILSRRTSVAEGVATATSVSELGNKLGVDLPIASSVNRILHEGADIDAAIRTLLSRPLKPEA